MEAARSTTFWDHQEKARARTGRLCFGYLVALLGIVLAVYLPVVIVFHFREISLRDLSWLWSGKIFLFTAGPLLAMVGIGTMIEMHRLSGGGAALARQLKARQLETPRSDKERALLNVIEEMSVASGIPVPPVFVFEKAPESLNALVAGNSVEDAAFLVTRGCLEQLDRDELQALVAHEFSHVFNGDMKLNLRVMGLTYGILTLAIVGLEIATPEEGFGCLSIGLAMPFLIIGGIGSLFAALLQKTISREREYLADASAVQFTRHPEAMISVMRKIEAGSSRVRVPAARAADHLFFADTRRPAWIPFFRTHPPLRERIRRIEALTVTSLSEEHPRQ